MMIECTFCGKEFDESSGYHNVYDCSAHLKLRLEAAEAEVERLKKNLEWGLEIVNRGLEIMTDEQLSEWEGVRAWAELGTE